MDGIGIKRIYEPAAAADGARVLVDRMWPRGVARASAGLTLWLKEIAPSAALRRWFGHRPERWAEFRARYGVELDANAAAVARLRALCEAGPVTLLHAARDSEHNHARALAAYLAAHPAGRSRGELLLALDELLEAERAGARLCAHTAREVRGPALAALVGEIRRDEAHWCGVLTRAIQALGGTPSRRTGAFYGKAMAIADLTERLAFLNRGQSWVVRRLRSVLPSVGDAALRAELSEMLAAHERNIERVAARLPAPADRGGGT